MFRTSLKRWLLLAAALVLPATLLHAALPTDPDISGPTSFTGQLLIASPDLHQPEFDHAVILLAQHTREGALGIVINRPAKQRPIADLLKAFGADAAGISGTIGVFLGGPVDPGVGLVLHSAEYNRPDTLDIDGRVALTIGPDVIRDIGLGKGPEKSLCGRLCRLGAVAARDDTARRSVVTSWRTGAGVRRRPRQGLGRRAGRHKTGR